MSGWFRLQSTTWPLIRDRLPRPLTVEEAAMDLRWRFYEGPDRGTLPKHAELAECWGWYGTSRKTGEQVPSVKRVRTLKADEQAWRDTFQDRQRAGGGQAEGSPRAGAGQAGNGPTPDITEARTGPGQAEGRQRASAGQAEGHTRVVIHPPPSPSPSPPPDKNTSPAGRRASVFPTDESWQVVTEAYEAFRVASGVRPSGRALTRSKGVGKDLVRCCRAHDDGPEGVARLLRWLAGSRHPRAEWYRTKRLQAPNIRRHLDELVEASLEPEPGRPRPRGEHRRPVQARGRESPEERIQRLRQQQREPAPSPPGELPWE